LKTSSSPKYLCFELFLINDIKSRLPAIARYSIVKYAEKFELKLYQRIPLIREICLNKLVRNTDFIEYYYQYIYLSTSDQDDEHSYYIAQNNEFVINEGYGYDSFIRDGEMYAKIHAALKDLSWIHYDYSTLIETHKDISSEVNLFESRNKRDALVMLSCDLALNYLNNEKTNREWELLRGFLAIKSLQGSKSMVATHKEDLHRRMIGAKTEDVLNYFLKEKTTNGPTRKLFDKFKGRYFGDQLLKDLFEKKFIRSKLTPRGSRVIYLSTSLTMDELAQEIINLKSKPKNTLKEQEYLMRDKISNAKTKYQNGDNTRHLQIKHMAVS